MGFLERSDAYWKFAGQCAQCGHCTKACDSLTEAGMTLGEIAKALIDHDREAKDADDLRMRIAMDGPLTQAVRGCFFCTSCKNTCFAHNDVCDLIYNARVDFQNLGLIPRQDWSSVLVDEEWDIFKAGNRGPRSRNRLRRHVLPGLLIGCLRRRTHTRNLRDIRGTRREGHDARQLLRLFASQRGFLRPCRGALRPQRRGDHPVGCQATRVRLPRLCQRHGQGRQTCRCGNRDDLAGQVPPGPRLRAEASCSHRAALHLEIMPGPRWFLSGRHVQTARRRRVCTHDLPRLLRRGRRGECVPA